MSEYDIEVISGDSYELDIIYRDSNQVPIDITGYEVYFQARRSISSDDVDFDKSFVVSSTDGVLGKIKFTLDSLETELLNVNYPSSKYVYGLRITSPDKLNVKTLLSGTIEVIRGVI